MGLDRFHFVPGGSSVGFSQASKPFTVRLSQSALLEAPGPIAGGTVGQVHARLRTKAEQIL